MTITPSAAREPYKAAAAAPFSTDMDSMSSGLMSMTRLPKVEAVLVIPSVPELPPMTVELSYMIPSTTKRGWLSRPSLAELPPRMIMVEPEPAEPPDWVTLTPATLPARELITLVCLFFNNSSAPTSVTENPRAFLSFLIPRAVTTSSSNATEDTVMVTSMMERLLICSATLSNPMNENRRVPSAGALMEYIPSRSVETPRDVPWTNT